MGRDTAEKSFYRKKAPDIKGLPKAARGTVPQTEEVKEERGKIRTLDCLSPGESADIRSVDCPEELRRRLLDSGLLPGSEVTLVRRAPFGDPLVLRVCGCTLALRRPDAAQIKVSGIRKAQKKAAGRILPVSGAGRGMERERDTIGDTSSHFTREREYSSDTPPAEKNVRLVLAGNPNCGKTALFNRLTGARQHVGNFPGVTVERVEGNVRGYPSVTVTDLPGLVSLSPFSGEERVARDFLINEKPDGIIGVLDASHPERQFYLILQLMELGIPTVLALNMMDEAEKNGIRIRCGELENLLGLPVVPVSALKNQGIAALAERAVRAVREREYPRRSDFRVVGAAVPEAVYRAECEILRLTEKRAAQANIPPRFASSRLLSGDAETERRLGSDAAERAALAKVRSSLERTCGTDCAEAAAAARYAFLSALCAAAVIREKDDSGDGKPDRLLLGKFTALPALFLILGLIFYLSFSLLGPALNARMDAIFSSLRISLGRYLTLHGAPSSVRALLTDGILAGVGSVLSFLPVILVLFFLLSLLEDSGYMARTALLTDRFLRRLGLSGRSFVPLLLGFGCTVPAVMAARTLPSDRTRRLTVILTPFMSCSAKLPVYAMFSAVFFPEHAGTVILFLYLLGIGAAVLAAAVLRRTAFSGESAPFLIELPPYRMPDAKSALRRVLIRAQDFFSRAFTVIFLSSVLVFYACRLDVHLHPVSDSADSLLAFLGGQLAPLFRPLGFSDWRASAALLAGFAAKENIVGTLTVMLGGSASGLSAVFSPGSAFVFLVFTLLYTPCAAAAAALRRELGSGYAAGICAFQCAIAWVGAFLVRMLMLL